MDDFGVLLKVVEGTCLALLSLSFLYVFLHKLVLQVEPQHGMHSYVTPSKS